LTKQQFIPITLLALALLIGAGAMAVRAGDNNPAAPTFGVIDMERLFQQSDGPQQLAQQTAQIEGEAGQRLKAIAEGALLSQKEIQEYSQLLAKATPAPADQERMKQLRELSTQNAKRMQTLAGQAALNDAEKKELRELTGRQQQLQQAMPLLQEDLQRNIDMRVKAVERELYTKLRTVVGQVAKEKGYTHVFSADVLIYSANDLTPQVIQKVKK
jgi:Skp family chaperone for outer membrane proteins